MRLPLAQGARPDVDIRQVGPRELAVSLSAKTWLAFVHLVSDRADLRFSDSYFDMAAGERRTITVTGVSDLTISDIAVRCWNDRTTGAAA
jgi:hypothetical protein